MNSEMAADKAGFKISQVKYNSKLRLDDQIVWGGSVQKTPDGKYHMLVSVWPRENGFSSWVTHSQVAYATADSLDQPFTYQGIVLQGSGVADGWDRDVIHNPTMHCWDGKYYLYYTGNYGNGEYWNHRNNQRIGVAVADHPAGPWQRFEQPVLDVSPDSWDCLITTNPSVTRMPDGRFIMVYKASDDKASAPLYGPVLHGVAFAESPLGPFVKHPEPIFAAADANFPGEDPYIFCYKDKLYTILKDMDSSYYKDAARALVLFESMDGIDWQLCEMPLVTTRNLTWEDGTTQEISRLERPQLYLENGVPKTLFTAVKPHKDSQDAFNLHFDVECLF